MSTPRRIALCATALGLGCAIAYSILAHVSSASRRTSSAEPRFSSGPTLHSGTSSGFGTAPSSSDKQGPDPEAEIERQIASVPASESYEEAKANLLAALDRGGLSSADAQKLAALLDEAANARVDDEMHRLIAASGRGKDLFLRAWMLAWCLSRHADSLDQVRSFIASMNLEARAARNLLLAVGMIDGPEAKRALLTWLRDPSMTKYQADILDALFQAPVTSPDVLSVRYADYLHDDGRPWPSDLGAIVSKADPEILEAAIARLSEPASIEVRRRAAKLLAHVHSDGSNDVPSDVLDRLQAGFLRVIETSDDPSVCQAALTYLGYSSYADADDILWGRYRREVPGSRIRTSCAAALARRAKSPASVRRVLDAIREEPNAAARRTFLDGFRLGEMDTVARANISKDIGLWASSDPDEDVRLLAVSRLEQLLPQSEGFLNWAIEDPSPTVRTKAMEVLKKAKENQAQRDLQEKLKAKNEKGK